MKRPRFIAGAVCPSCGVMDRLQVLGEGADQIRRCVSCGHEDQLPSAASRAPRSRLDGALTRSSGETTQSIRILEPDPDKPADRGSD